MNIISNAVRYNKEKGEILLSYYETQVDDMSGSVWFL